ncbi:MAG: hypothetical protein Tsb004_31350 [Allomuricauda sp.]
MVSYLLVIIIVELFLLIVVLYFYFQKGAIRFETSPPHQHKKTAAQEEIVFAKYKNNGISDSLRQEFKEKLVNYFERDKPYLDSNLKLKNIAEYLNLSRNQTSQIINQSFQLDFNSFVNAYRIEHALELINEGKFKNISDLVYDSGFNNATSFNKSFKKITSFTPREYINKVS